MLAFLVRVKQQRGPKIRPHHAFNSPADHRLPCLPAVYWIPITTCITPSTYINTSFVSDLVLAKSVAVGKMPRQALLFDRLLYWPHIAWVCCHHYQTESIISGPWRPRDKIWEWPGDKARRSQQLPEIEPRTPSLCSQCSATKSLYCYKLLLPLKYDNHPHNSLYGFDLWWLPAFYFSLFHLKSL